MPQRTPRRSRILLWLTATITAVTVSGCSVPASLAGRTHPAPAAELGATVTDGRYTLLQEPQAGYGRITELIEHAATSVDITMYQLADNTIENALIDARRRGVTIAIVLDTAWHGRTVNQAAYDRLTAAGIPAVWAPAGIIVHEKAIVIDDSIAIVSTANFTSRYYATGRDAMIETTDPADVTAIAATIRSDYAAAGTGRLSLAKPAPNLIWSPAARSAFIQTIDHAQHTLDLTSEEFKDRPLQLAVAHAAQRGVDCRIVLNSDAATTAAVTAVKQAGCTVHTLSKSAKGLYMHQKIILTDTATPGRATALIGSHNASTRSLTQNRELSIKLDNLTAPRIIAACQAQFTDDFTHTAPA